MLGRDSDPKSPSCAPVLTDEFEADLRRNSRYMQLSTSHITLNLMYLETDEYICSTSGVRCETQVALSVKAWLCFKLRACFVW